MHIGILQTGHIPDSLEAVSGDYPEMFRRLLGGHGLSFSTYAVVDGTFPEGIDAADGWLITGSRHGAYEDHDWIPPLEEFIRAVHAAGKPMVGICFGHQIIAQALGGKVVKYPEGWSVGRTAYRIDGQTYHMNAWHQDQVVELPEGARVVGASDFCANAALAYGDTIFTVQPHPEFEPSFVKGLIETRGKGVVPDPLLAEASEGLAQPLDNAAMGDRLARFLIEAAHVKV
ncbi:type 1 glutamine amidotransferase [Oceaniglobus roseus]|uniref:type 1 glutamine amidotransferase n=1 Tax=Oceaniglobus roseus TaxID=1737570 RepID=UPI000C7F5EE0|nr:type 1 glutamine amidotransferase [Kandeliimicrobium roseum]